MSLTNINSILNFQFSYKIWRKITVNSKNNVVDLLKNKINFENKVIYDLGCGDGYIYELLFKNFKNNFKYFGFDNNENYIKNFKKKFTQNVNQLICCDINNIEKNFPQCDIFFANGLIHHLNDQQVESMFRQLKKKSNSDSVIIHVDPVFYDNQSKIRRIIMSQDRGRHIRSIDKYLILTSFN